VRGHTDKETGRQKDRETGDFTSLFSFLESKLKTAKKVLPNALLAFYILRWP
jgi:hypothetical protein